LNKHFEKTCWLESGRLTTYTGNYQYAREKRKELEKERSQTVFQVSQSKKEIVSPERVKRNAPTSIDPEKIEANLEELELAIYELEAQMEKETDLVALQQYQDEWNTREAERTSLYELLEDAL
jgi:ATPase subunit of ABC transporter with duplicated ATPase domains